jgi:hypothetical protein
MTKFEKKGVSIVVFIVILLMSGCSPYRTDEPQEVNYRVGTEGLTMRLPTDTPTQIYERDSDVRFIVEVRNKGAFPQSDEVDEFRGKLWVGGFDDRILQIYPRLGSSIEYGVDLFGEELEGKSPYNQDGGYSAVEFQMDVGELPQGMPYYRPRLIITSSYFYKTIANPMICVDPEPRSTRIREKVCEIGDYGAVGTGGGSGRGGSVGSGLGSQGAPIAVTRVEEDVTTTDILFKIYIQNLGSGENGRGLVILESDIDLNPNEGYDWRDMNLVRIEDIRVGNLPMTECRPSIGRDVQLIEDKGYIFCRLDKAAAGGKAYVTPLNIVLSYGYTTSVQRDVEIFEEVSFR